MPDSPPVGGLDGASRPRVSRRILIRSPEVRIKGRNRPRFREALKRNIRERLGGIGLDWRVRSLRDRVWIDVPGEQTDGIGRALDALETVFGVELALPGVAIPRVEGEEERLLPHLLDVACALAEAAPPDRPDAGFAVRVRRRDPAFPLRSQGIAEALGKGILERTGWRRVNLSDPALVVRVDNYEDVCCLSTERRRGPGGLPVGVAGRFLALLSGGFDSPVAAWLLAGRGAQMDFLHVAPGHPHPDDPSVIKACRLAAALSRYTGTSRLVLVPFTRLDLELAGSRTGYEALLFRRFALRCGEEAASRFDASALVTGDSLSQVASQTIENLIAVDAAVSLPVLRPLIGLDKASIMARAAGIGTRDISVEPAKDCCALIARSPRTRSRPGGLQSLEQRLLPGLDDLLAASLRESVVATFAWGDGDGALRPLPDGAPALLP